MIRRDAGPDAFLLIPQHDHALLAGELARHLGNAHFSPPDPLEPVLTAIAQHDSGWPLHDDAPTLNPSGLPLHVFEASVPIATKVWSASVDRATALDAYAGLLVSLHVLNLSGLAVMHHAKDPSRFDVFDLNKFQHRQIEVQESLRPQCGLTNDGPRHLGLAPPGASPADDRLLFNFRLLTFMDRVSLSLCCGELLFPSIDDVLPAIGARPTPLRTAMPTPDTMTIDPWPFDATELTFDVPARRVARGPFADDAAFRAAYAATPVERLRLAVRPPAAG